MMELYTRTQNWIAQSLRREEGQGMVEYALIIGLVAIGVLALLTTMGGQVGGIFQRITNAIGAI